MRATQKVNHYRQSILAIRAEFPKIDLKIILIFFRKVFQIS